tara:strand:- start:2227 stop:3441 length:1215 start_codon:yes stop_codon:yes gene_type:complete
VSKKYKILAFAIGEWQKIRYKNIFKDETWKVKYVDNWDSGMDIIPKFNPDIILTYADSYHAVRDLSKIADINKIPSLLIADGVLEWRHQWENPKFGFGGGIPYFQKLNVDKIACYGYQDARILESWGNINKCEVTGAARFDNYSKIKKILHSGPRRILVLSANTPGYTDEQKHLAIKSFQDIHKITKNRSDIEIVWRLRKGLEDELGFINKNNNYGNSLNEILPHIDGAISQPSTVALETMRVGIPTAILDYQNSPNYIRSGWSITSSGQIENVLNGLSKPPQNQMLFQDELLNFQLYWQGSARKRVLTLISKMINIGRICRENGDALLYPRRIIPLHLEGHSPTSEYFDYEKLYPLHPIYKKKSINRLQNEIIYLQQKLNYTKMKARFIDFLKTIIKEMIFSK